MNLSVNPSSNRLDEEVSRVGILNTSTESLQKKEFVSVLHSELLPSLVYVSLLLPLGVTGNILTCCVYNRKWERKRKVSTLFILTLAWVDLLNCLSTMPFEIALLVNITSFDYPILCKISRWLTYHLNCFSTMILLGIALDRLFGIRYTFKRSLFGITRCKIYLAFSFVIAVLTTWPALFLFGTYTNVHHGILSTTCLIDDDYILNQKSIKPFWHGIYLIVSTLVVDIVLIVIYSMIGCSIHQSRRNSFRFRRSGRFASSISFKRCSIDSCCCNTKNNFSCSSCRIKAQNALTDIDENLEDDVFVDSPRTPRAQNKLQSSSSFNSGSNRSSSYYSDQIVPAKISPTERRQQSFRNSFSRKRTTRAPSTGSRLSQCSRRKLRFESLSNESMRFGPRSGTRKTLVMLCVVTAVYILTFLPYCVIVILRYTSPRLYLTLTRPQKNIYQLFIRSYMLSMSTNSIVYSFVNNNFRQECYLVIKSGLSAFNSRKTRYSVNS